MIPAIKKLLGAFPLVLYRLSSQSVSSRCRRAQGDCPPPQRPCHDAGACPGVIESVADTQSSATSGVALGRRMAYLVLAPFDRTKSRATQDIRTGKHGDNRLGTEYFLPVGIPADKCFENNRN